MISGDNSLTVTTAPLPAGFPGTTLLAADPARMEPGFTVLDSVNHGPNDPRPRYAIIVKSTWLRKPSSPSAKMSG